MTRPIPIPPEVQEAFDRAFTIEGRPFACAFAAALAAARPVIRSEALEEAAKACEAIEDQLDTQWRGGLKVCSYTEGASDGANDCAAAIRALKEKSDG